MTSISVGLSPRTRSTSTRQDPIKVSGSGSLGNRRQLSTSRSPSSRNPFSEGSTTTTGGPHDTCVYRRTTKVADTGRSRIERVPSRSRCHHRWWAPDSRRRTRPTRQGSRRERRPNAFQDEARKGVKGSSISSIHVRRYACIRTARADRSTWDRNLRSSSDFIPDVANDAARDLAAAAALRTSTRTGEVFPASSPDVAALSGQESRARWSSPRSATCSPAHDSIPARGICAAAIACRRRS